MGALRALVATAAFSALLAAGPAVAQFSDREYRYEPAIVVLSGVVATSTGTPAVDVGTPESREIIYLLELDRPIIVIGDATHDYNSQTEEVSAIQLTRSSPRLEFASLVGRRAKATGRLFHGHSAYHHAKVLMMVLQIEAE